MQYVDDSQIYFANQKKADRKKSAHLHLYKVLQQVK